MRRHRKIFMTSLTAIAVAALTSPAGALANSLLSGYGGPGQGSQQILGSTVVGAGAGSGGSTGGGSSSGGGGSSETGSSSTFRYGEPANGAGSGSLQSGAKSTGAGGTSEGKAGERRSSDGAGTKPSSAGAGGRRTSEGDGHRRSVAGSSAYPTVAAEQAYLASAASAGSRTGGLSGNDLLYVLLAVAILAVTGVSTKKLAGKGGSAGHQSLKGRV
jgi:hypothetical protein